MVCGYSRSRKLHPDLRSWKTGRPRLSLKAMKQNKNNRDGNRNEHKLLRRNISCFVCQIIIQGPTDHLVKTQLSSALHMLHILEQAAQGKKQTKNNSKFAHDPWNHSRYIPCLLSRQLPQAMWPEKSVTRCTHHTKHIVCQQPSPSEFTLPMSIPKKKFSFVKDSRRNTMTASNALESSPDYSGALLSVPCPAMLASLLFTHHSFFLFPQFYKRFPVLLPDSDTG